VVVAGWITSDLASPTFARCENTRSDSMKRLPACRPPWISNENTAPQPSGSSFLASALSG
jgi:hypothetical protein